MGLSNAGANGGTLRSPTLLDSIAIAAAFEAKLRLINCEQLRGNKVARYASQKKLSRHSRWNNCWRTIQCAGTEEIE